MFLLPCLGAGELTAAQLVDGRLAFVCVNTTAWGVVGGRVFMNSCGMSADFAADPAGDAARADAAWASWFGPFPGPLNDKCVQDGATWGGPPNFTAGLLPPSCNIL